jgi:hypothetical protein
MEQLLLEDITNRVAVKNTGRIIYDGKSGMYPSDMYRSHRVLGYMKVI